MIRPVCPRFFVLLSTVLAGWLLTACDEPADAPEVRAPLNILLITADDLGLQLGSYGDRVIQTPNLDALAASGVQFDIAYVAQASCSPSRAAIFTGLFPHSNGQLGVNGNGALHPQLQDATLPNILGRAGYRTGLIGKLHVDPGKRFAWDQRPKIDTRDVRQVAEEAGSFMAAEDGQPFFLMVSYSDPHFYRAQDPKTGRYYGPVSFPAQHLGLPAQVVGPDEVAPLPFQGIDTPEQRARIAGYYSAVLRLDTGVGLLLAALRDSGREEETLVLFLSDHGPPFTRAKTTPYEAGLRVPFLVRWPGVSSPARSDALVSSVDILPTVLDAAGVALPGPVHGRSLRPVLTDPGAPWRTYLAGEYNLHGGPHFFPQRAIRDHRYKLIQSLLVDRAWPLPTTDGDLAYLAVLAGGYAGTAVERAFATLAYPPEYELYDLASDPWEFHNLADHPDHADQLARLQRALTGWRQQTDDPFLDPTYLEDTRARINGEAIPPRPDYSGLVAP